MKTLILFSFHLFLVTTFSTITPNHDIPLFKAYPKLKDHIPHVPLGNLDSTPIYCADKINQTHQSKNTKLYIKHDGIDGTDKHGAKIFTGNKRRKLEFLLADALAKGAKHIYAPGAAGSNFATATAAYAQELGLACTLILGPQRNTQYTQRNLKLDLFYNANLVACPTNEARTKLCKDLAAKDAHGYFVPIGGSNTIGAIGYVNAAFELKEQIDQKLIPKPDVIYIAVSSAAMAAGLIVGLQAAKLDIRVNPIGISGSQAGTEKALAQLIQETSEYLHGIDQKFPLVTIDTSALNVIMMAGEEYVSNDHATIKRNQDFGTYALTTPQSSQAIKTLHEATDIKLDGTYAGKAFAACLHDITSSHFKDKTVLFWASFCPGDFSECTCLVDAKKLPDELRKYIDRTYPIQALDEGV